jgi:hypothetical protein
MKKALNRTVGVLLLLLGTLLAGLVGVVLGLVVFSLMMTAVIVLG